MNHYQCKVPPPPTECHYLRQDRKSTEPPCTLQHSAVMLRVCSMLLTIANSPAGLWSDKICKKRVKLLTLYKAWLETGVAFRCECPAAGLTCQVHPGQSLQIHNSNKNKQRQNEPSLLRTLTQLLKYSPSPFTISKKSTTVKFQTLFRNKNIVIKCRHHCNWCEWIGKVHH